MPYNNEAEVGCVLHNMPITKWTWAERMCYSRLTILNQNIGRMLCENYLHLKDA